MQKSPRKLISLTLQDKVNIIEQIENGKSVKDVSKELGISKNTLHYIFKNRYKIRSEISNKPGSLYKKRIKQLKSPDLEEKVLNWMNTTRENGEKVTGSQIKAVALEIALKTGNNGFSGSNGWLCSFLRRHEIVLSEFNADNEKSIQKIKIMKGTIIEEPEQEIESIEFDPIEEIYEKKEEEKDEKIVEVVGYSIDWRSWCRLCSSSSQVEHYPGYNEILQKLFNIEPDESYKICEACQTNLLDIIQFLNKGITTETMLNEVEALEAENALSYDILVKIRGEFGLEQEEEVICEDVEMNDPLSDEQDNCNTTIEEFIYEEPEETAEEVFLDDINDETTEIKEIETSFVSNASKVDESEYNFDCHLCPESFERMCFLTNHTREAHQCLPQVACITCGKYLATWETILSHRRKHSKEIPVFECKICSLKFVTPTGLAIHVKIKHDKNQSPIVENTTCELCQKEFRDASILKAHMRTHLPDDERFPYGCEICSKRLANKYSLKHHILTVHEQSKHISCHLCPKKFSNKSNLRSHLISHSTENIKCPICEAVFKNRVSLQSHKKLHKENAKNFACPECDKLFFNRHHLQRHRISHSDVRSYKCSECNQAYKWEKDLKVHIATVHESSEAYGVLKAECPLCDDKFSSKITLTRHIKNTHQDQVIIDEVENI